MYLHLGQGVVVPEASVIGIFDLDNTTGSKITRKFLENAEKDGRIVSVSDELPKSFVVCCEDNSLKNRAITRGVARRANKGESGVDIQEKMTVFLSQLSSQTLLKRSDNMRFEL